MASNYLSVSYINGQVVAAGVTGTMAASESGSDTAAIVGNVIVAGALAATETGSDSAAIAGKVYVSGDLAATEAGSDSASISGNVLVSGSLAATETGQDTAAIAGNVITNGILAAVETGSDTASLVGKVIVKGQVTAVESGPDTFAAQGIAGGNFGVMSATETGSDTAAVSGTVSNGFAITGSQALLLFKLYQLHGLAGPLTVASDSRSTGDIVQSVSESAGVVTVTTTSFGGDSLPGSVGTMIEELAALHGLTASLIVSATTRTAGSIVQELGTSGTTTTVTRQ